MREWPATVTDAPRHPAIAGATIFEPGDLLRITARDLLRITGGRALAIGSRSIRGGAVDSRRVARGNCFFALPGERTDGQSFVGEAVERGAAAVVLRDLPEGGLLSTIRDGGRVTVVQLPDALAALHAAAGAWRARFRPLVVGVTGTLAKTSTKEQIAEVLSERWTVLRNQGNENNEIGLPLTLLRLSQEHSAAVLEMGMYEPTDIQRLAALARPSIGVVTAVRGTHISRAGSMEAIERGKAELVEALPADGTAILNADDERVLRMRSRTAARVLTYGFDESADVRALAPVSRGEEGMSFTLVTPAGDGQVRSPALGMHSVHNALAAAAVGIVAGLDLETVSRGLARPWSVPHRTVLLRAGDWRILDDSYNAAPDSMIAALDLLASLPGRRIAVLGEMMELGDAALDDHRRVGRHAASSADVIVTVGDGSAGIADGAIEAGAGRPAVHRAADRSTAITLLAGLLGPGDVVLVKGSRGAALEMIVDDLVTAAGGLAGQPVAT